MSVCMKGAVALSAGSTIEEVSTTDILKTHSTGVITGGVLTKVSGTSFQVAAGTGRIVDHSTGAVTNVSWGNLSDTPSESAKQVYVYVDSGGTLTKSTAVPTGATRRNDIYIGMIHLTGAGAPYTALSHVHGAQEMSHGTCNQVGDVLHALGTINISGNEVSQSGGALKIMKSEGTIMAAGVNYDTDIKRPHIRSLAAIDTAAAGTFTYVMRNGDTETAQTNINPDVLDNNTDYPGSAVASNKWTNQRIYVTVGNTILIQPGQNEYTSRARAEASLNSEAFTMAAIIANALHTVQIGTLTVQDGETDLSNAAFHVVGKFGNTSFAAGSALTHLQNAYTNSGATPEIVTSTSGGDLVVKRGSAADTDKVFEIQNGAGGAQLSVHGDAVVLAAGTVSISAPGTLPTSSTDTVGTAGAIKWDADYLYIRVGDGADLWKRVLLSTF